MKKFLCIALVVLVGCRSKHQNKLFGGSISDSTVVLTGGTGRLITFKMMLDSVIKLNDSVYIYKTTIQSYKEAVQIYNDILKPPKISSDQRRLSRYQDSTSKYIKLESCASICQKWDSVTYYHQIEHKWFEMEDQLEGSMYPRKKPDPCNCK